jgi:hypothetical protein
MPRNQRIVYCSSPAIHSKDMGDVDNDIHPYLYPIQSTVTVIKAGVLGDPPQ